MEYEKLLEIVGDEAVFESGLLLAGSEDPLNVYRQLSRWVSAGKIYQLRRGVYTLAAPYRKTILHPFLAANRLQPASYVSLQSALSYYGMIPEYTPVTTSVTTRRPENLTTPLGRFHYQHIDQRWFHAYRLLELKNEQSAFVATPAKALLDLIYLHPGADKQEYLVELRLQFMEQIDMIELNQLADQANKPKLKRAVEIIQQLREEEMTGYEIL